MTRILIASLLLLLGACSEPFIVFAGGKLNGPEADPPGDWSIAEDIDTVQLETRPADPYSINIWATGIGPDLYVATGEDGTRWTEHLENNRDVRVRIEDTIFPLEAVPVLNELERKRVSEAYVEKYDLDPDDNWVMTGMIYRLDRR